MTQEIIKAKNLIPFLNQKYKVDLKYNKDSMIERKELITTKVESINEEEGTVLCTISTQGVDRVGDIVISKGIDTTEFQKINSVYINHDYSLLPIGSSPELIHKDGSIMATIKFVLTVPAIKNIFELVKAGAMKGISIGFDSSEVILKGTKAFDDTCKSLNMDVESFQRAKRIIKSWKLYEFSLVSIPANADCYVKNLTDSKQEVSSELTKYLGIKDLPKNKDDLKPMPMETMAEIETPAEDDTETPEQETEEKTNETKDMLSGGRAELKGITEKDVDAEQLSMGIKVEYEHTKDPEIAKRIALDHLAEYKDYYTQLAKMEEAEETVDNPAKEAQEKSIKDDLSVISKELEVKEEDFGELIEKELVLKPFPSEHSARQESPSKYKKFRRQNDKFGKGLHAIFGITEAGKAEIQSIRASADKFTVEEFRTWLKKNNFKTNIVPAKPSKSLDVPVQVVTRFIKVLKTAEDQENIIKQSVAARIQGKTRLEIKIK